jgi:hypothetical protein
MTPKEKAIELCQKYQRLLYIDTTYVNQDYIHPDSQKCALIAAQEVRNAFDDCHIQPILEGTFGVNGWDEVIKEIKKL